MLDDRIVTLSRKTAEPQLKDLDQPLATAAGSIQTKFHGYGHKYTYLLRQYEQEVGRRAQVLWRNLHRAHQSIGAPYYDDLRVDLMQAFTADLDAVMSALAPRFEKDMQGAPQSAKEPPWSQKFADAGTHERTRYEAEIDHYVTALDAALARGRETAAAYVIHGNVGALMTGPGAVANVIQNITLDQRDELLKSLELVKQALAEAPELQDQDRNELADIADEAASEVSKERPNTRRLSLVLQSLAAAVQGTASGAGAYEALRAAAAAIGIPV